MTMKAASIPVVDLPRFLRAVEKTNPFKRDAVTGTKGGDIDVQEVHRREFQRIQHAVEAVRTDGGAAGVLLIAPAGLGKSHLLARLERWAREDARCTMVILHNVVAAPERMARAVLGATLHLLAGAQDVAFAQSDLYALLNYAVRRLYSGRGAPSPQVRIKLLREAGGRLDPRGDILAALIAFLQSTMDADHGGAGGSERAQLAIEWLSGQQIDATSARDLGLRAAGEVAELPEGAEERVLAVLAGLGALAERPFILCLDQVDNLDAPAIAALTRFLHGVVDQVNNLVVITSGVKDSMLGFHDQGVIPRAAWDRMAQVKVELPMILPGEAKKIVAARVERFTDPFRAIPALDAVRRHDPLFPISSVWLDGQLRVPELRPRDVISWCRERWACEQRRLQEVGDGAWLSTWGAPASETVGGVAIPSVASQLHAAIDAAVSLKITEAIGQRRLRPQSLPPDESRLSELVLKLLSHCTREPYTLADYESCPRKPAGPYHLLARERANGKEYLNGVTFIATTSKTAGTNALKRITADPGELDHRLLVTDERRPLEVGPKGQAHLAELRAMGSGAFREIRFRFDDYALLDALAAVLGAARVGDLEIEWPTGEFRPVREAEAAESMHRGKWFLRQPLLAELLTEESATRVQSEDVITINVDEAREFIVAELSWRICMTARELAGILVQRNRIPEKQTDAVWFQLKEVARGLGAQGHVDVTASEDDLFLQSMGKQ